MADTINIQKGFNSFSGVDIKAVFGTQVIAELQAISYSITREKAPLYTMGAADPRSFSRGKRGIAGTLIFLVFDRHALLGTFGHFASNTSVANNYKFLADKDEAGDTGLVGDSSVFNKETAISDILPLAGAGGTETGLTSIASDQTPSLAWFVDQLPPFDITLAAANEYGSLAVMRIFGAEILNEGYGVSIDDIVSEQQMTYVARTLVGWRPAGNIPLNTVVTDPNTPGDQSQTL